MTHTLTLTQFVSEDYHSVTHTQFLSKQHYLLHHWANTKEQRLRQTHTLQITTEQTNRRVDMCVCVFQKHIITLQLLFIYQHIITVTGQQLCVCLIMMTAVSSRCGSVQDSLKFNRSKPDLSLLFSFFQCPWLFLLSVNLRIIFLINHLVYKMSENSESFQL